MPVSFDVRIVILLSAALPLVLGALMYSYWRSRKTYRGFGFWLLANFAFGLGFVLILLRGQIPVFLTVIVANALLLYGLSLLYDGIQLFLDRPAFDVWNHLVFGLYLLLQLYLTYLNPNINARIVLMSIALFIFTLRAALALLRQPRAPLRGICRTIALIFIASAVVSMARAVYGLYQPQPIELATDATVAALSFGFVLVITVLTFYLFFLHSARLELDLQDAQQDHSRIAGADRRRVVQLGLLDEASRSLAESLDEIEVMRRTVKAVVDRFGYAEAAISLLVEGDHLEIAVIGGTEDVGYKPGYRQKVGEGIIGHTAQERQVYVTGDVEHDPYYYSIGRRSGSAACIPMLDEGQLLGVLYVESTSLTAFGPDDIQTLDTLIRHAATAIQKARLYARAQAHVRAIATMQSVSQTIVASLELQEIFQSVVQLLKDTYNYTYVSIYTLDDQVLRLGAQAGYPEPMVLHEIPASSGVTGRAVQTRQIQFIHDVSRDPAYLQAAHGIESELCVPLLEGDRVLGVINVEAAPGQPLAESDVEVLSSLAGPVVIAIENARLHAEAKQLALTDALTGTSNRRAFDQRLDSELDRAIRYRHPLALVIIDMDSFKEYNDRWGHPAGDQRLKDVADLLKSGIRSPDFVARYGGEEFALILPHTSKTSALVLAERLRGMAEKRAPDPSDGAAPIAGYTFSMGVAVFPEDGQTVRELVVAADRAELTAKHSGKNRICAAGDQAIRVAA